MNLLEHELVRKYFKSCCGDDGRGNGRGHSGPCPDFSAVVLKAMQEPIRYGERYLQIWDDEGHLVEVKNCTIEQAQAWHPNILRLPERFQKPDKCLCYRATDYHKVCDCNCHQAVEEKIDAMLREFANDLAVKNPNGVCWDYCKFREHLRELVSLAREQK